MSPSEYSVNIIILQHDDECLQCRGINTLVRDNDKNAAGLIANEAGHGTSQQSLTPQQLLVVAGILAGLLEVDSILIDRDGQVDIVLTTSYKTKKQMTNKIVTLFTREE